MALTYDKLTEEEISEELQLVPGWTVEDNVLTRTFNFESYASGVVFANAAAHAADTLNHHPDLLIGYQKVEVSMTTHDAGGLTGFDFELARRITAIAP